MSIARELERTIYYIPQPWAKLSKCTGFPIGHGSLDQEGPCWGCSQLLYIAIFCLLRPISRPGSRRMGKTWGKFFWMQILEVTWVVEVREVTHCRYIPYSTLSHALGCCIHARVTSLMCCRMSVREKSIGRSRKFLCIGLFSTDLASLVTKMRPLTKVLVL